jgi:hypothetical protein
MRTDAILGHSVDFYEKSLGPQKTAEEVQAERIAAFERKFINKVSKEYEQTLATFSADTRTEKEQMVARSFAELDRRLAAKREEDKQLPEEEKRLAYGERQQAVLKLKLARYFQKNDSCDLSTLFDALIETPKFMDTDKGSLFRLFEVHEEKTLQKVAELRKQRAELGHEATSNPFEALYTTSSGKYYMARLLNMPHLEQESEYMNNCVGTSDSYLNRMKRGEIEILSFRHVPTINPQTGKLEGDTPILTIEYDLKNQTIQQIKKYDDAYLEPSDPFFADVIEALKTLRTTTTDTGTPRAFSSIAESEFENIPVKNNHLFTDHGEVHFRDFDPDSGTFILKRGILPTITQKTPRTDAVKLAYIVDGIRCHPEAIAYTKKEITERTQLYIGPFSTDIFINNPSIGYIYTSFSEKPIVRFENNVSRRDLKEGNEFNDAITEQGMGVWDHSRHMLTKGTTKDGKTFDKLIQERRKELEELGGSETITFVRLTVNDMFGDGQGHTTKQIWDKAEDLGLELCPPETGPLLRLAIGKDQPYNTYWNIAHEQIAGSGGGPCVFRLGHDGVGVRLGRVWAWPDDVWHPGNMFVFRLRK